MYLAVFLAAAVQMHSVTPALHMLNYFTTTSTQVLNVPEYWELAYVDGVQILHYDSNSRKIKVKQQWVSKISADDRDHWDNELVVSASNAQVSKDNLEIAKKRFNQTGGVHMFQVMYGCEWNDETGEVDGWEHIRYDGVDFLSFEAKTMTWIAAHPQAFMTKIKWDQIDGFNAHRKNILIEMCPFLLKKYVSNGKDFLTRTELPKVSLLQKTPSSGVTCHATGFYPSTSSLFWRKDGEEIHEDVEMGETLPNHDGTFQTSAHLKVEVTPATEGEYECVFQLAGVQEAIVTKLDARSILSNARIQKEQDKKKAVAIAVPLVVLTLMATVVAVFAKRFKTKQDEYAQASISPNSKA